MTQLEQAKAEAAKPFGSEERLSELLKKKVELDLALAVVKAILLLS